MELTSNDLSREERRTRIFRWYYYFGLAQFLLYFIVPIFLFPTSVIKDIEVVSALTLGLVVGFFFFLVNIFGLFFDRTRRALYGIVLSVITAYFIWAIVSWAYIEKMDYLLR